MKTKKLLLTLLVSLLVVAMMLSMVACGGSNEEPPVKNPAVTLNKTTATMNIYDELQLSATLTDLEGTVVWSSSDSSKATVSSSGLVKALAVGSVEITATVGEVSAKCAITISNDGTTPVLSLDKTQVTLVKGNSVTVTPSATWKGQPITDPITWEWLIDGDSADDVVTDTVDNATGAITFTGAKYGETKYTVYATIRGVEVEQSVTVTVNSGKTFDVSGLAQVSGGYVANVSLVASGDANPTTITPVIAVLDHEGNAVANAEITWTNSNDTIASFDQSTLAITALLAGETTIVGTHDDITITIHVNAYKPTIALADEIVLDLTNPTMTLTSDLHDGAVISDVTVGEDISIFTSVDGKAITLDAAKYPRNMANYGADQVISIVTDRAVYTVEAGVYSKIIDSADDLAEENFKAAMYPVTDKEYNFEFGGYFLQTADIDMAGARAGAGTYHNPDATPMPEGWTVQFVGVYDGQNHTIYNVVEGTNQGLFGQLNGTVKNLLFVNASLTGEGGIVTTEMYGDNALIENVAVYGTMSGSGAVWAPNALILSKGSGGNLRNCLAVVKDHSYNTAGVYAGIAVGRLGGLTAENVIGINLESGETEEAYYLPTMGTSSDGKMAQTDTATVKTFHGWDAYLANAEAQEIADAIVVGGLLKILESGVLAPVDADAISALSSLTAPSKVWAKDGSAVVPSAGYYASAALLEEIAGVEYANGFITIADSVTDEVVIKYTSLLDATQTTSVSVATAPELSGDVVALPHEYYLGSVIVAGGFDNPSITIDSETTFDGQPTIKNTVGKLNGNYIESGFWVRGFDAQSVDYVEVWVKSDFIGGAIVSTWWADGTTAGTGVKNIGNEWTRVRFNIDALQAINASIPGQIDFSQGLFLRILVAGAEVEGNVGKSVWFSKVVASNFENVIFNIDADQQEMISVSETLQEGTATISVDETKVPSGFAVGYFTVDGVRIDGNTFVAMDKEYDVKAVLVDLATPTQIVLDSTPESFIKNADGSYTLVGATIENAAGDQITDIEPTVVVTDNIGNTYEVVGGVVTLKTKSVVTLTVTYSYEGLLDKSYTVRLQSNDGTILQADEYANMSLAPMSWWQDTDMTVSYDAEKDALKYSVKTNESGILLPLFDFADYDYMEFSVMTPSKTGASIGAYWCFGQPALTPGEWQRVRFDMDDFFKLNAEDPGQYQLIDGRFSIRFMNLADADLYITDVVASTYDQVALTKKGEHQDTYSFDKATYMQEETVTINLGPAPENYALSEVLVNGAKLEAVEGVYSFVAFDKAYEVEVVYLDKTLTYHVVADGTYGEASKGSLVAPAGKVVDGNGEVVDNFPVAITAVVDSFGNELVFNAETGEITLQNAGAHAITVTYTNTTLPAERGVLESKIYIGGNLVNADEAGVASLGKRDASLDFTIAVDQTASPVGDASLKVTFQAYKGEGMTWTDGAILLPLIDLAGYDYVEFWAKVDTVYGDPLRFTIAGDPGRANGIPDTWTRYRFDLANCEKTKDGRLSLGLLGGGETIKNVLMISDIVLSKRSDVALEIETDSADYISVATVKQDQTATIVLNKDALPDNMGVNYYTVDGVRIEGNTFTAWNKQHTVGVVLISLDDAHHITLDSQAAAVSNVDGLTYALIGAKVYNADNTLLADKVPTVTVVDNFGNEYDVNDNGEITLLTKSARTFTVTYAYQGIPSVSYTTYLVQQDGTLIDADSYATLDHLPLAWWQDTGTTMSVADGAINIVPGTNESGILAPLNQQQWNASQYVWVTMQAKASAEGTSIGGYWFGGQNVGTDWTTITLKISGCNDWNTNGNRFAIRIMNAAGVTISLKDIKVVKAQDAQFTILDATDLEGNWKAGDFDADVNCATDSTVTYNDKATIKVSFGALYSNYIESGFALSPFARQNYDYVEFYAKSSGTGFTVGTWWGAGVAINNEGWTKIRLDLNASHVALHDGGFFIRIIKEANVTEADLAENVWISDIVVGINK